MSIGLLAICWQSALAMPDRCQWSVQWGSRSRRSCVGDAETPRRSRRPRRLRSCCGSRPPRPVGEAPRRRHTPTGPKHCVGPRLRSSSLRSSGTTCGTTMSPVVTTRTLSRPCSPMVGRAPSGHQETHPRYGAIMAWNKSSYWRIRPTDTLEAPCQQLPVRSVDANRISMGGYLVMDHWTRR